MTRLCGELGYPTDADQVRLRMRHLLNRDDLCLLVAEVDRAVVGWIHVGHGEVLESEPWAEVEGLVVTESMRGQGVGRALMSAGERWARGRGMALVRLRSNVVRAQAHAFYRRCGYEVFKTQLNFRKRIE
ncbi:MAG: GNAT family N-acetyltransferase [Bacteroidales bacterium]